MKGKEAADYPVVLVDSQDRVTGVMDKMKAHRQALLHRAVSVFVINSRGEWLLQRRAKNKYHSAGLWTNTCCTHPFPHENYTQAALRRLREEMGIGCELKNAFHFIYRARLDAGLTEYELDHVFVGVTDDLPQADPEEVWEWKYISFDRLHEEVITGPERYTYWFRNIYDRVEKYLK